MKRLAGILLLAVVTLAFFPGCRTVEPSTVDNKGVDLTKEIGRLEGLYKEAVRVPITPQIVGQVREEKKDYLLGEIRYFPSVNIALMHSRAGESSMTLETRELPRLRRASRPDQPSQNAQEVPQDTTPEESITFHDVPVLTFREGGSSLDQRRITSDDEGHLKNLSPEGDVFEIYYPGQGVTLGFSLNREENWYDLEFAIDESTGERTSLAMTGVRPHLMINYQAVFPLGETRIQMDRILRPPEPPSRAGGTEPLQSLSDSPPPDPFSQADSVLAETPPLNDSPLEQFPDPPAEDFGEDSPFYPEEGAEIVDLETGGEGFYLEKAPPTPWGEGGEELYLGGGEGPEVEVVLLTEETPLEPAGKTFPAGCYIIQVGAFREKRNAAAAFAALEGAGFQPLYEPHLGLTRVLIPAVERGDLPRIREKIKALGLGEPYVRQ
ncbi:MAG: SPOR domain-containing protein [Treponema sp.]|jgi:hypothetical protein|nr:SPOR domain-containing protein [Treponema sp.]